MGLTRATKRTAATVNLLIGNRLIVDPTKAPLAVAAECVRRTTVPLANGTGRPGLIGVTTSEMTNAISARMKTGGPKIEIRNA